MMALDTPVPILQHPGEFEQLLDLYRTQSPHKVLEIGTYFGGTLYHWLQNAAPGGATVVSVDTYVTGVDNRSLYEFWCPDNVRVVPIEGDSHDLNTAASVARYGQFDWVWIDAGHYYNEVKRDWELYGPQCRPGGIVCFHDILPPSHEHPEIQVNQLWLEIQAEGYATEEIIKDSSASWGGIGVVHIP